MLHKSSEEWRGCVIVDESLPDMNGLELHEALLKKGVVLPVIVTSACADIELVVRAMKLGVHDFVGKPFRTSQMVPKIQAALRLDAAQSAKSRILQDVERRIRRLTARETEILTLLFEDKNNKQISKELMISPRTVERHRANIKEKLELHSIGTLLIRCALASVDAHPVLEEVMRPSLDCKCASA
jgi:two-component system response regulator FixJ